jgi:hypothetical protein
MARLPMTVHLRAMVWLATVALIDAGGLFLPIAVAVAVAFDNLLRGLAPRRLADAGAVKSQRRQTVPAEFWLFGAMLAMNVAFRSMFIDAESAPYALNIVLTHLVMLMWAWLAAPTDDRMLLALHRWSQVFIYVLSGLLFMQIALREAFDSYLDLRLLLTGEASRSAVAEFSEGSRPTSLFAEPSNHAVVVFVLTFVHSLTGRQTALLAVVAACSCLLTSSSMGALLALILLIDTVGRHVHPIRWLRTNSPALLVVPVTIVLVLAATDVSDVFARVLAQVLTPETGYDPIAVRLYVPLAIAEFEAYQHLFGSGLTNYASFPEGLTLNDSSLLLAAYFQMGMCGLILLFLPLRVCLRKHGWRAAFLLSALYLTKLGLLVPAFWGLAVLVRQRGVEHRAPRVPMKGRADAQRGANETLPFLGRRGT